MTVKRTARCRPPLGVAGALLLALLALLTASPLAALPASAAGLAQAASWLDQSPLVNWNVRGAPVPQAPRPTAGEAGFGPPGPCAAQERTAVTPEEKAVSGAGWRLFNAPAVGASSGDVIVVSGTAGYDGMCRPAAYNQFVFVGQRFAGTISPTPMTSRTDGAGGVQGAVGPTSLTALFSRYGDNDPLCCPSRQTTVTYRIDPAAEAPLLVPTGATTGTPGSTPPPAPPAIPLSNLAPGTLVALRGTPHLWVAESDGLLHWLGDTRALAGRPVNWGSRIEADVAQLRGARLGDPYLSAGLVRVGTRISLPKWEQGQAQPTLYHIQNIGDVELFGINGSNYGRFVLEGPAWSQRYGFNPATLPEAELPPAVRS